MPRRLARVLASLALALTIAPVVTAQRDGRHALVGTLARVDGQTLTVLTSQGTETVTLSSSATVRLGSRMLTVAELASRVGTRIKVRYLESGGQKQAQSVTVATVKKAARTT